MDVGVITYWPDSPFSNHDAKRWLSFYIFSMQAFGADTLILINGPEIKQGYDIEFEQYATIEEALEKHPDCKVVTITGEAEQTLQGYEHPENCLYMVGNDYAEVPEIDGDHIRIDNSKDSKVLWSHNCVSITLYDRYVKCGSN